MKLIDQVQLICAKHNDDRSEQLYDLYVQIDKMLRNSQFDIIDEFLKQCFEVEISNVLLMITILDATHPYKHKFEHYIKLYEECYTAVYAAYSKYEANVIMRGLK